MAEHRHHWIRAPHQAARSEARTRLELPPVLAVVSAHRRLRGPYTAAGGILRALVPDALVSCPELVARHDVEILSTTPELRGTVPADRETLTSLAVPEERTRFYSRLRTLRIAHGLAEFLGDYLRVRGSGPHALVVEDLHEADPTDRELLAVLVRRLDPALLTIVVSTDLDELRDPDGPVAVPLQPALERHCVRLDHHHAAPPKLSADPARAFVDGDGVADDPHQLKAYGELSPRQRAALHDARRQVLEQLGQPSLALGAIAWHAQHGSDPAGAGADALVHALDVCMDLGFYHAVVDYATRGRTLVDHQSHPGHWWAFTTKMTTSLAALGLPELSLPLYDEARALSASAEVHMQAAYATAMLFTRHLDEEHRDHQLARGWVNQAIAFAGLVGEPKQREMRTAFNRNGLALIAVRQGRPQEALALLDSSLARLDETLEPHEHALHRSVLRYNRAQVYAGLGRHAEAIADYTTVIALDPNYAEYWFDRGMIQRRLGLPNEALADYEQAIRLSPPFPEAYYNRADVRAELGDLDGAWRDVTAGLAEHPSHVELLCFKAQLHTSEEAWSAASDALAAALEADPECAEAWALRGVLAYRTGDLAAAVADLERALAHGAAPAVSFNLAVAHHDAGHLPQALALLNDVVAETDDADARLLRARCLVDLGRHEEARAELTACVSSDPGLSDQAEELLAALAG